MADEKHIKIVLKGAEQIAAWRARNPGTRLDLSGANLRRADLQRADLRNADFLGTNLEWADLRWTDFMDSDMSGANLTGADFHKADLREAILQGSILYSTNLEDASLVYSDLTAAHFKNTRIINTDFTNAEGLDKVLHDGQSEVDRETLAKNPNLPMEFLRATGLYSAYRAVVYRVVSGSPSDVSAERMAVRNMIYAWNDHNAHHYGAVLLPVLWETHALPELGDRPQGIIDRQLIETSQILVCIFWARIGTPTGEAEGGTVEEINKFLDVGKPVMVYFCKRPLPQAHDAGQWWRLKKFKEKVMKKGLIAEFETEAELDKLLTTHLTQQLKKLHRIE